MHDINHAVTMIKKRVQNTQRCGCGVTVTFPMLSYALN